MRVKEIVAGSDQSKAAKAAPTGGHQDRAVGMAGVIAAKQKWRIRKVMSLLYREGTIPLEECPAKAFEAQTAKRRRAESIVRAVPAIHLRQDIKQIMNL
jgi:hypothetical protein